MPHFNFTGLHSVFKEAIRRHEPTVAFPLVNGRGRFLFLMFIPTDSKGAIKWSALELFIILSRTQGILRFDLKGNHYHDGAFQLKLTNEDVAAIRAELGLADGVAHTGPAFVLSDFLADLNAAIPTSLPLEAKVAVIQENPDLVRAHCGSYVEDALKVYLLGPKPLANPRKPREETLRKLYSLKASPQAIAGLVRNLKSLNWTVSWTATKPTDEGDRFEKLWLKTVTALKK